MRFHKLLLSVSLTCAVLYKNSRGAFVKKSLRFFLITSERKKRKEMERNEEEEADC